MDSVTGNDIAFVAAAYAATWIAVIGYLLRLRGVLKRSREAYERAGGAK